MFMSDGGVLGFNTHYSYTFDFQWTDLFVNVNFTVDKAQIINKLHKWPLKEFVRISCVDQNKYLEEARITGHDKKEIFRAISDSPILQLKGADYIVFNSAKCLGLHVHVKSLFWDGFALRYPVDFQEGGSMKFNDFEDLHLKLFGENALTYRKEDITWCQEPEYFSQPAAALMNQYDPDLIMFYKAVFILIGIPDWSESRQQLVMLSEGKNQSGISVKIKDNVETCFKTCEANDVYSSSFED